MGVRVELASHLARLMNPEDAARYGNTGADIRDTSNKSSRKSTAERKEQGDFANWLLLQNSRRGPNEKIRFVWHATHARSKATPGTPDFYVGINGRSLWFEFKRDLSCALTPEQKQFRLACEAQRIKHHVVHSAAEAIEIVQTSMTTTKR